MPPQLLALSDGPSILLDKPILLVGRHQECDIQIPSRKISRRHCCIAQVNDHLVVRDLCSTNGIRINGIRVFEGSLKGGDELTIGNLRYEVRMTVQAGEVVVSAPAPAPAPKKDLMRLTPLPESGDPLSCDQPVPLAEPGSAAGSPGEPPKVPPLLLPANLELAASKDFPVIPPQQPPPAG